MAEQAKFDIDEAAAEPFVPLDLPAPPMTLGELDAALNQQNARPSTLEWKPLDPGSYAVALAVTWSVAPAPAVPV